MEEYFLVKIPRRLPGHLMQAAATVVDFAIDDLDIAIVFIDQRGDLIAHQSKVIHFTFGIYAV